MKSKTKKLNEDDLNRRSKRKINNLKTKDIHQMNKMRTLINNYYQKKKKKQKIYDEVDETIYPGFHWARKSDIYLF